MDELANFTWFWISKFWSVQFFCHADKAMEALGRFCKESTSVRKRYEFESPKHIDQFIYNRFKCLILLQIQQRKLLDNITLSF